MQTISEQFLCLFHHNRTSHIVPTIRPNQLPKSIILATTTLPSSIYSNLKTLLFPNFFKPQHVGLDFNRHSTRATNSGFVNTRRPNIFNLPAHSNRAIEVRNCNRGVVQVDEADWPWTRVGFFSEQLDLSFVISEGTQEAQVIGCRQVVHEPRVHGSVGLNVACSVIERVALEDTFRISGVMVFGPTEEKAAMKGAGFVPN
ncbi:ubiquitin-specific protease 27 [Striga asiatica]|uniref:Ubiquitin-specific protease 27 n=1 Tax=Striga asiatica TaxID=4170 RepID=A0A5A7R9W9_STRAF|nr:ubiquitin-specific protease 27 [Striga asiatica]